MYKHLKIPIGPTSTLSGGALASYIHSDSEKAFNKWWHDLTYGHLSKIERQNAYLAWQQGVMFVRERLIPVGANPSHGFYDPDFLEWWSKNRPVGVTYGGEFVKQLTYKAWLDGRSNAPL